MSQPLVTVVTVVTIWGLCIEGAEHAESNRRACAAPGEGTPTRDAGMAQRGAWRRRRRLPARRQLPLLLLLLAVLNVSDGIGAEGEGAGGATAEDGAGGTTPSPAAEPAAFTSTPAPEVPPVPTCADNCTKCSDRFAVPRHCLPPLLQRGARTFQRVHAHIRLQCLLRRVPALTPPLFHPTPPFCRPPSGPSPRSGSTFVTVKCFRNHVRGAAELKKTVGGSARLPEAMTMCRARAPGRTRFCPQTPPARRAPDFRPMMMISFYLRKRARCVERNAHSL